MPPRSPSSNGVLHEMRRHVDGDRGQDRGRGRRGRVGVARRVGVDFQEVSGRADGRSVLDRRASARPGPADPAAHPLPRGRALVRACGGIGVRIGDRDSRAGPGATSSSRATSPHTFWNAGPEPARLLEVISPAGFENFFAELGELAESCPPEALAERRAELARDRPLLRAPGGRLPGLGECRPEDAGRGLARRTLVVAAAAAPSRPWSSSSS